MKKYPEHKDLHYLCSSLADIYMRSDEYDKAIYYYNSALNQQIDATASVQYLCGIAAVYWRKMDNDKAMHYFSEAVKIAKENSINSAKIFFDIGEMYFSLDFNGEYLLNAREAFKEALNQKKSHKQLKDNIEFELQTFWYLGSIAYEIGENSKDIEKYFSRVLELMDDINHPFFASSHLYLGHYSALMKENGKAREHYNAVLTAPLVKDEQIEMATECLSQLAFDA